MEDTIFGPLTFKQFLYLAGGAGLCFIWYVYLSSLFLSALPILATAGLAAGLAFYKYNGRDSVYLLENALHYFFTKKLFLWQKSATQSTAPIKVATVAGPEGVPLPKLSASKLEDLTWSLDVKDRIEPNQEI